MNDKDIYYKNKNGEVKYNELCEKCANKCKQSFRTQIFSCKNLKEKRKKK